MSKYSTIADEIKKEIRLGNYSSDDKLPTEYELSLRFSVSRQTIRQALQSLKNEGVVYQKQGSGTFINKSGAQREQREYKNILVVCTYISDYIFPSIVRGIEEILSSENYNMSLAATGNKVDVERQILLSVIEKGGFDALIVEGTKTGLPNPNIKLYERIEEVGIPIVFLHCTYPELKDAVVCGMDDYEGGKDAAIRLVKRGCKKIGAIFKSDDRQGLLRYKGFIDGVLESGLGLDRTEVRWFTTEDTKKEALLVNLKETGIDGLICYNDQIATEVIKSSIKYSYQLIPLVSFDDSYLCKNSLTPFFSEGHRKEELGQMAATMVINMIKGKREDSIFLSWKRSDDE